MKRLILAALMTCVLVLPGCKDSEIAQFKSMGSNHKITIYSGGVAVATYHSTGNVSNQEQSDGWYFMDKSTGKLVEVAGTMVIEQE